MFRPYIASMPDMTRFHSEEYIDFLQVTTLILMLIPSLMLTLVGCC